MVGSFLQPALEAKDTPGTGKVEAETLHAPFAYDILRPATPRVSADGSRRAQLPRPERKLRNVKTVDQLMKDHFAFLNTTRKELMFTDLRYLELHSQLTTVINVFVENRTRFQDQVLLETERWKKWWQEGSGARTGVAGFDERVSGRCRSTGRGMQRPTRT